MTEDATYMNTLRAARYPGLSEKTLRRYRVSGDGPVFCRLGARTAILRRRQHAIRPDNHRHEPAELAKLQPPVEHQVRVDRVAPRH